MAVIMWFLFRLCKKRIIISNGVRIRGLRNIETRGLLQVGLDYAGFMNNRDLTYIRVDGHLIIRESYSIGKGCRVDVGRGAIVEVGRGYMNANSSFVIMHGLKVGNDCAISWGVQILDDDFHEIQYAGKKRKSNPIEIGNHVWIGSNVTILKGVIIPDGCVVASGAVVISRFTEKNCLIGGNPARVIRKSINWS